MADRLYTWLAEALDGQTHVVTASRRLARELRRAHANQQIALGREAWPTPPIDVLDDWIGQLVGDANDRADLPIRIDSYASNVLWERCLRKHLPDDALNVAGIARQARQTWQLLNDWQVPMQEVRDAATSDDEQLFTRVAIDYIGELTSGHWVDGPGLTSVLIGLVQDDSVTLPDRLYVTGFDRLVPSQLTLIRALESAGCEIRMIEIDAGAEGIGVAEFKDSAQEFRAAGAWARQILHNDSQSRIGIVALSLENDADSTWRCVMEGLAPGWQRGTPEHRGVADVSYGRKLATYPAVNVALLVLKWIAIGITSRELSLVLRSKVLGDGGVSARAALEYALRDYPDRTWSVSAFGQILCQRADGEDLKSLLASLSDATELSRNFPTVAGPSEWADHFDALLKAVTWPGGQVLDSEEFQLISRWRKLLNEFAGLDPIVEKMERAEAVSKLAAHANDVVYQSETAPDCVHILGALEAAGLEFDALWVSGMDATQWPPSSRPAAFVSRALQRKYEMPDATPADTLNFARRVLQRLTSSAQQVVLSWSNTSDDAELLQSPLVAEVKGLQVLDLADPGWYANRYASTVSIEIVAADPVPAVTQDEQVRGGAYTIDLQAREPLAAFVRGRLGVQFPGRITAGLSSRQRGIVVHDALRNLLAHKPSRSAISTWSDDDRSARIGSAIDGSLARLITIADPTLQKTLLIERRRLRKLMQKFIAQECERGEFSVHQVESDIDYRRGDVHLRLRSDRIDLLPDNQLLVIDYKTGAEKSFLNRDGEPSDLQLVVYADALDEEVGGLSLINIDSRLISYKGEGAGIEWGRGNAEEWSERLQSWRKIVHDSVDAFAAGDVRADILAPQSQSRFLQILSRVEEMKRADRR